MSNKGNLYLIPSTLGEGNIKHVLPEKAIDAIQAINHYIVENERTARRFLIKAGIKTAIDDLTFFILDKRTEIVEANKIMQLLLDGYDMGLLSEAGLPAIADPGAMAVQAAHEQGIQVIPITGPSSIFLALMASGLNGQNFAFNGYLPINKNERKQKILFFESRSRKEKQTQIFIETPYRNNQLFEDLLKTCQPNTRLCVAVDITLKNEFIQTKTGTEWKKEMPNLHKRPCIFIVQAY